MATHGKVFVPKLNMLSVMFIIIIFLSSYLFIYIFISIYLSIDISIYLSFYWYIYLFIYLSIDISIFLSIFLLIYLSIYLYSFFSRCSDFFENVQCCSITGTFINLVNLFSSPCWIIITKYRNSYKYIYL